MSKPPKVLENGRVSQEQLEDVVGMALQSLKTLMVDYETPIEVRLQVALKIFEIFGTQTGKPREEVLVRGIEQNAHVIETNAHRLSHLETLLEMIAQQNTDLMFQQGALSPKKERIISH